ncbi:MAG: CHRD domain-containing protein [Proteobacteria bacterium]|nr:CHRD domain-containing protein [Pseudomonadota bacterium]
MAAAGMVAALAAGPVAAKALRFKAALSGQTPSTMTGSKATGRATIEVDTDTQAVSVALDVKALDVDALSSSLKKAPTGPIHLQVYASHSHGAKDDADLLFPLPYGPTYAPAGDGFKVTVKDQPFPPAAKLVGSKSSFDNSVASLQAGRIVLNIHTNAQPDDESSGDVVPGQGAMLQRR